MLLKYSLIRSADMSRNFVLPKLRRGSYVYTIISKHHSTKVLNSIEFKTSRLGSNPIIVSKLELFIETHV